MKTLELCERLFETDNATRVIQAYHGLLEYYGLCQAAVAGNNEKLLNICREYLAQYPDSFDHPSYNFESYRVGGNGKAWMVMKGLMDEKENLRKYAEITMNAPKDTDGIMCMPGDDGKEYGRIWIDVVTCTTPFMLYAGLALNEQKYIDFAADQCFKMYEFFLDKTCGLLHQGRGFRQNPKLVTDDHWSRGNGWGFVGLAELVRYLPEDSQHRPKAEKYFKDLAEAVLPYQNERGLWRQEMTKAYAWEESSGTALILYCLGIGMRYGLLPEKPYMEVFRKGIDGIIKYCITEDFCTERSCPGCLCPGTGENIGLQQSYLTVQLPYTNEPHSFGSIILALVEAHKNGMVEVEFHGN